MSDRQIDTPVKVRRSVAVRLARIGLMSLLLATSFVIPAGMAAATGTSLFAGSVDCDFHSSTRSVDISLRPAHVEHEQWKGTFKTWSYVQYSWDAKTWYNWFPTAVQSWPMDIGGASYALAQGFTVSFQAKPMYVRAYSAFEFYDTSGRQIGSTTWLIRDYYHAFWDDNYSNNSSTATGGCGIPKA